MKTSSQEDGWVLHPTRLFLRADRRCEADHRRALMLPLERGLGVWLARPADTRMLQVSLEHRKVRWFLRDVETWSSASIRPLTWMNRLKRSDSLRENSFPPHLCRQVNDFLVYQRQNKTRNCHSEQLVVGQCVCSTGLWMETVSVGGVLRCCSASAVELQRRGIQ